MDSELRVPNEALDNIYILPFKFKHMQDLLDLHSLHGEVPSDMTYKNLPKIGYIAYLGKSPVAAGFLRRVEPCYAQFDTFVSNPYFGSQIRNLALSQVVDALTEDAKNLDLEGIIAFTKDEGIFNRAKDEGFRVLNQVILAKRLK